MPTQTQHPKPLGPELTHTRPDLAVMRSQTALHGLMGLELDAKHGH